MLTGYRDLDALIGGFAPGDLVLLGGKTGTGKSAFALNVARYAAQHGEAAAIFSFETTHERVKDRLTSTLTSVPLWDMLGGNLSRQASLRLIRNTSSPIWSRLYIVGSANLTVGEMRDRVQQISRDRARAGRTSLSLVVADPLQLMVPATGVPGERRPRQLAATIIQLKRMARDLRVSVLLVAQLGRHGDDRHGEPPRLSDLEVPEVAESYADKTLLLHRDAYSTPSSDEGIAEIIVAKQRNGPTGKVKLAWRADCGSFSTWLDQPASTDR